ncbi:MAG: T9SS type A sorting domain-containing protein [Ignavibacteria bacterium]|nr:T9SS type A sorting domain-containing protein [Ignavibacteria bacterium]
MRTLMIVATMLCAIGNTTVSQSKYGATNPMIARGSGSNSSPVLVLENGLNPSAVLIGNKETICMATNWIGHYPLIAQRVDSTGRLLWKTVQISNPQNSIDQDGKGIILPRLDGGTYSIFEFWEFKQRSGDALLYASYPHIQLVDASGNVLWGVDGKRLTNMIVGYQGGADVSLTSFAPDGDVIVYWRWFAEDSSGKKVFATYAQKVDRVTGEFKFGQSGKKLFDDRAALGVSSKNGNTYFVHGGDSIACLDAYCNVKWHLPLLDGVIDEYSVGTNDFGEVLVLHTTAEGIKGRLYGADGVPLWSDKLITSKVKRILFGTKLVNWCNTRWVFSMFSAIFCVDREGTMCWSDTGIVLPGRILDVSPVDESNVVAAFQRARVGESFTYDLYTQKVGIAGAAMWQPDGIKIIENIGTVCRILPDSNGGSYLVFDAMAQYEPAYRPRGTYWQMVNKHGEAGIITDVSYTGIYQGQSKTVSVSCYPNRFNHKTTITYSLPAAGRVSLKIFNLIGQEVAALLSGEQGGGAHQVVWNASQMPSGIYLVRLEAANNVAVAKLQLLK